MKNSRIHIKREEEETLSLLYPLIPQQQCQRRYRRKRAVRVAGSIVIVFLLYIAANQIIKRNSESFCSDQIIRPDSGSKIYELTASDGNYEADFQIRVSARRKTGEELDRHFEMAQEKLKSEILGDNPSLSQIETKLNLAEQLKEFDISIRWDTKDTPYILADGTIDNRELKVPATAEISAILSYGEEKRRVTFSFIVCPKQVTGKERFADELTKEIERCNEDSELKEYQTLPSEYNQRQIVWRNKSLNYRGVMLLLGIIVILLAYAQGAADISKKRKKREEELKRDYPVLLEKMMLLLGAGMTIRGAWEKLVADYRKTREKRYVYEEMIRTLSQMELGVPEDRAYEEFGIRCGQLQYLRFVTLMTQNLKKGSRHLLTLLQAEAQTAFSERKESVKKKGEEAGTKLLIPMGGMFVIVLVVILVPAFASF